MANPVQAYQNIKKYGLVGAVKGAFSTPGGVFGANSISSRITQPDQIRYQGAANLLRAGRAQQTGGYAADTTDTTSQLPQIGTSVFGTPPQAPGSGSVGPAIPQFQQYFNGQLYTDINAYNQAQEQAFNQQQQQANTTTFNGQTYTDVNEFTNALRSAAQTEYDNNIKEIDRAYQSGLISFDERQQAINTNRENIRTQANNLLVQYQNNLKSLGESKNQTLRSQQNYFAGLGPDAVQSEQQNLAQQTEGKYQEGVQQLEQNKAQNQTGIDQAFAQLGTQEAQLNRGRSEFENNVGAARTQAAQSLRGQLDTYENQARTAGFNADQAAMSFKDQLANNRLGFENQVKAARSARSANVAAQTKEYDPVNIINSMKAYARDAQAAGLNPAQIQAAITGQLQQTGIKQEDQNNLLQYIYQDPELQF